MNKITTKEELLNSISNIDKNTNCTEMSNCKSCQDCNNCINCEQMNYSYYCVDCKRGLKNINCTKSTNIYYCVSCDNCNLCDNCVNCKNCYRCTNCKNIINGRYMINNLQFTEEEYHKILSSLDSEEQWKDQNRNWKEYTELMKNYSHTEALYKMNIVRCEDNVMFDMGAKEEKKTVLSLNFKIFLGYFIIFIGLISFMVFTSYLLSLCFLQVK